MWWSTGESMLCGAHHHMHLLLPCNVSTDYRAAYGSSKDSRCSPPVCVQCVSTCRDGLHLNASWHQQNCQDDTAWLSWWWVRSSQGPSGLRLWWQWTPGPQDTVELALPLSRWGMGGGGVGKWAESSWRKLEKQQWHGRTFDVDVHWQCWSCRSCLHCQLTYRTTAPCRTAVKPAASVSTFFT